MAAIEIKQYRPEWKSAFVDLNKAWIEKYFRLEPSDTALFEDVGQIVAHGGCILFAFDGEQVVGTVALVKTTKTEFELSKFAVDEACRGMGVGSLLMDAVLQQAQLLGAKRIFLEGNTKLDTSIYLYRKNGFTEVTDYVSPYQRVDIVMEKFL
ncbi:MAG: GNAT family N-acetyltransferase [Chitinophagaceae bacterium]